MYNIPFVVVKCIVQLYSITVTVSCCICTVRYEYSCMYWHCPMLFNIVTFYTGKYQEWSHCTACYTHACVLVYRMIPLNWIIVNLMINVIELRWMLCAVLVQCVTWLLTRTLPPQCSARDVLVVWHAWPSRKWVMHICTQVVADVRILQVKTSYVKVHCIPGIFNTIHSRSVSMLCSISQSVSMPEGHPHCQ